MLFVAHDETAFVTRTTLKVETYFAEVASKINAGSSIALLTIDTKPSAYSSGKVLVTAVHNALAKVPAAKRPWVIYNTGDTNDDAKKFYKTIAPLLNDREGMMSDGNNDPDSVYSMLKPIATNGNIGYGAGGQGVTSGSFPHVSLWIDHATWYRTSQGYSAAVPYAYTIPDSAEAGGIDWWGSFMDADIDGLIPDLDVNPVAPATTQSQIKKLKAKVNSSSRYRLATAADNPFTLGREGYALTVETGHNGTNSAGTDGNVTFTLTGTEDSSSGVFNGRTQIGSATRLHDSGTDYLVIPSKDLGKLKSLTMYVSGAVLHNWTVSQVKISSFMHGIPHDKAPSITINKTVSTTSPVTIDLTTYKLGLDGFTPSTFVDVNGDGKTDACGRSTDGVFCATSNGASFNKATLWSDAFTDAGGWSAAQYSTIQFPDLNGDGKKDMCGRGVAGILCALSNGTSFGATTVWSDAFSDAHGWGVAQYYSTIKFADVNGDGKTDVCGRGQSAIYCALCNGAGFGTSTPWSDAFADAHGWGASLYYSSMRLVDVNGDRKADVCARGAGGLVCALSSGSAFGKLTVWSDDFADVHGWDQTKYASTIRFADVNGDGKVDACGRGQAGEYCAISNSASFAKPTLWSDGFADVHGWDAAQYYSTMSLADVNGDGKADLCARGQSVVSCALSTGASFSKPTPWSDAFADAHGWGDSQYYSTIQIVDVNADRKADICAHSANGEVCGISTGSGFRTPTVWHR